MFTWSKWKSPEKYVKVYNCVLSLTTHANPHGAATTWVVCENTWLFTCFGFLYTFLFYSSTPAAFSPFTAGASHGVFLCTRSWYLLGSCWYRLQFRRSNPLTPQRESKAKPVKTFAIISRRLIASSYNDGSQNRLRGQSPAFKRHYHKHQHKPRLRYGHFTIFKMAAVRHLVFVIRVWGPPTKGIWWSLSLQNLVGIGAVVLKICTFFDFASLAWKCLFTP